MMQPLDVQITKGKKEDEAMKAGDCKEKNYVVIVKTLLIKKIDLSFL